MEEERRIMAAENTFKEKNSVETFLESVAMGLK